MARIGCCITAHGLGHAARACAVMEALHRIAEVHIEIISRAPAWFFQESLSGSWTLYPLEVDVGLVQHSALQEDLGATVLRLQAMYPPPGLLLEEIAGILRGCRLVLCDIAPIGIAAARLAGVPSVLVENFTWDWIYEGYLQREPALAPAIAELWGLFALADYHLQTEPVCRPVACDLCSAPVSRGRREGRLQIRRALAVGENEQLVLLTMGGVGGETIDLDLLRSRRDEVFVLPGRSSSFLCQGNLRLLPASGWYHPDLVAACDAVIGKIGYSTLAEVYQAGVPYGFVTRQDFRESGVLADFVAKHMSGRDLTREFAEGAWLHLLPELLASGRSQKETAPPRNGAVEVAAWLVRRFME